MEEKLILVKPTMALKEKALEYRNEHYTHKEMVINGSELFDNIPSYEEWLTKVKANAESTTVDKNWVLTDTFFALRESDKRIVGMIDLRYELNDFLKDFGNCGYSVRPSERGKGYATRMLELICRQAKEHGLQRLQLSVEPNNIPSVKTIIRNHGRRIRSFLYEGNEVDVYYIDL